LKDKEETMRLMSRHDLARHSDHQLAVLHAEISRRLRAAPEGSPESHEAMAALETIRRELAARRARPRL
jgi:hypothetical protein